MCASSHQLGSAASAASHLEEGGPEDHTSASETERTPVHAQKPQLAKSLRYADYV